MVLHDNMNTIDTSSILQMLPASIAYEALQNKGSTCHETFTHDTGKTSSIIQGGKKKNGQ